MNERITIAVTEGVADMRLNRPDKRNALDLAMFEALSDAAARLDAMRSVRAVALSGEGDAFCAGIDLGLLSDGAPLADLAARTHGIANLFQNAAWAWRTLRVPVIAAVHGVALGGGFQIMLGADIRIVAPDATLSIMEAHWGIVPDMAGTALLRGLVRDDIARELTYSARRFDGEEAMRLGLATRLAPDPRAAALALAREIAAASPQAVQGAKRLFNLAADRDAERQLLAEARAQQPLLHGADMREAIAAAAERRPPRFADPA